MKMLLIFSTLTIVISPLQAQILNQDAEGKSSIVWNGSTLGIDLPDGLIKVNYYKVKPDTASAIYGFDLQAKNKSGVADIFNKGKYTPNTSMSVLFGRQATSFSISEEGRELREEKRALGRERATMLEAADNRYKTLVALHIKGCKNQTTGVETDATMKTRAKLLKLKTSDNLAGKILLVSEDEVLEDCKSILEKEIKELSEAVKLDPTIVEFIQKDKEFREFKVEGKYRSTRGLFYTRLGLETLEFKRDLNNGRTNFNERFVDTLQVSGFAELGCNLYFRKNIIGITGGISGGSNFASLTKDEYRYTKTDTTITGGKLDQTQTITAYKGEYKQFSKFSVTIDYIRMIKMEKGYYYAIAPYLRYSGPFDDKEYGDALTALGINASIINGKTGRFMGGIYFQTDDLFTKAEDNFGKTIRFGFVSRFAFINVFPKEMN